MSNRTKNNGKFLLHACCGPCSMEPVRILREGGIDPVIYYANSNIHPREEYERRLETLHAWADGESLAVAEGPYRPRRWEEAVGCTGVETLDLPTRRKRCRLCYRLRFEEAARYARANGFDRLGTTLSVSPYQFTDAIREELERAATREGIAACFADYRPFYPEATRRSRAAGMYRQNYCGCRLSRIEADWERRERREQRARERLRKEQLTAEDRRREAEERARRRAERALYDEKQRRKREILRDLRMNRKGDDR